MPRECSLCGEGYNRSNRLRLWTTQNHGHRDGWQKTEPVICTRCLSAATATRIATITKVQVIERPVTPRRKAKAR